MSKYKIEFNVLLVVNISRRIFFEKYITVFFGDFVPREIFD